MGTFRLYPSKSNTILEDSPTTNTGLNEVAELWYGVNGLTRHLFKFYFEGYYLSNVFGYVPDITGTTSEFKIKLINPIELDTNEVLAESFDLEVYAITRDWDEGSGYNFIVGEDGVSNWQSATTIQEWTTPGGDYSDLIFSGHVDVPSLDDEMIALSYTNNDALADALTGNNYGFILKYSDAHEALSGANKTITRFHTNNSHTYFKPFIEITWEDSYSSTSGISMSGFDQAYKITMPYLEEEYPNYGLADIPVNVYTQYTSNTNIIDNMEYKISLIDGRNKFIMSDWDTVPYDDEYGNKLTINLGSYMADQTYLIEFRYSIDTVKHYMVGDTFKFRVVEA